MTNRIRVGVIFGGKSGEHEVSVQSASSMLASLDPQRYVPVPVYVTKEGQWRVGDEAMTRLEPGVQAALLDTQREGAKHENTAVMETHPQRSSETALLPAQELYGIDVIIPVLHGSNGEDGTMQGMLELLDLPYVGAGVLASAVGLDKVMMKRLFAEARLPQVRYTWHMRSVWDERPQAVIDEIEETLGYPCFVKPANLGSSVGISKAKNRDELVRALSLAAKYDRKLVVEEGLDVREVEVAVLGNDSPRASVPGEVIPSNEFYDYHAKYLSGESELIIPAPLPASTIAEIRTIAVEAFRAIDCSGLARVDFFVEKETHRVLVNEINTMPGFTRFSMYPKLWEATGLSYPALVDELIQLGLARHEEKQRNVTDFHLME